jgi:excisionase family DNA binding protein
MAQPSVSYTTAQVAEMLNCSVDTVVAMCKNGQLRHLRLGRQFRITEDPLEALAVYRRGAERADARRALDEAIADGRLPAELSAESQTLIARILRNHLDEQADRPTG